VGVMQKRSKKEKPARRERAEQRAADELDELIEYGRAALTAPGSAPLAMQLDTALRVAGLHLRRAHRTGVPGNVEDLRWAVTLASFVAERSEDTPPAAVVELGARAVAVLELCAPALPDNDSVTVQSLATRTRDRLNRAEQLCALSLDQAIASLTLGKALLTHAPTDEDHDEVTARARALLTTAAIAARRAGNDQLAEAAITLIEAASRRDAPPPPAPKKRGLLRR